MENEIRRRSVAGTRSQEELLECVEAELKRVAMQKEAENNEQKERYAWGRLRQPSLTATRVR
jgi:hypothetical protein